MVVKWIILGLYALMIVIISIKTLGKTSTFSDFFLGSRKVGPIMTAFTYGTAYFSAVLFIGFAGKIGWGFGYSGLWIAAGNAFIGVLCVWKFLGARVRRYSIENNISTMPEFLEKRYDSRLIKLFAAICVFVFLVPYSSAVFIGLAYLFKSNFNIDYWAALLFIGGFTALYLALGGYKSMSRLDVIFGIIMTAGCAVLLWSTISKGGGLAEINSKLAEINPALTKAVGPPGFWPLFSLVFLTSIAPFCMPQLLQKFFAIKDEKSIKTGMIASTIFAVLISGVAYFVGSTARLFLTPDKNPSAFSDGKPVFDALMPEFLASVVPEGLSIIILILIISASMSTLAALVLISSSAVSKDLTAGFIKKDISDKKLTMLMRASSLGFVIISVIIAYFKPSTIVGILSISWGAIGSVFLGPFIWGIFTKWANKYGAAASGFLGLSVCLILYIRGMSSPEAGTIGMLVSLTVNPVVSLISNKTGVSKSEA